MWCCRGKADISILGCLWAVRESEVGERRVEQGGKGRESGGSVSLVGPQGGGGGAAFALDSRTCVDVVGRPLFWQHGV